MKNFFDILCDPGDALGPGEKFLRREWPLPWIEHQLSEELSDIKVLLNNNSRFVSRIIMKLPLLGSP